MFNFNNIGGKIKGLAKVFFIVEAICTVISGIAMISEDEDLIATGLMVMIVGPIVAYVSSWILYAFGELVEDVSLLRGKVVGEKNVVPAYSVQNPVNYNNYAAPAQPGAVVCRNCGSAVVGEFCGTCGAKVR